MGFMTGGPVRSKDQQVSVEVVTNRYSIRTAISHTEGVPFRNKFVLQIQHHSRTLIIQISAKDPVPAVSRSCVSVGTYFHGNDIIPTRTKTLCFTSQIKMSGRKLDD